MIKSPVLLTKQDNDRLVGCVHHYLHLNPRETHCAIELFRNNVRFYLAVYVDNVKTFFISYNPTDDDEDMYDGLTANITLNDIFKEVIDKYLLDLD